MIKKKAGSSLSKLLVISILGIFTAYSFSFAQVSTTTDILKTENIPGGPVNVNLNSLKKNSEGVPIVNPEQVLTEGDLLILQSNYKILNPNIDEITVSRNTDRTINITVHYKHPGNFLGILPSSFRTITSVSSSVNNIPVVDSELSFWSSLVADKKYNREKIINRLSNNNIIRNEMKLDMTPTSIAQVIETIVFELDQNELESNNAF